MNLSPAELAVRLADGDRLALARALSLAERDPAAATELVARLTDKLGRAKVVGITGPPGAGKSTLIGVLVRRFLDMGKSVAVLAVDPSSPVTGGALLGDRFRIGESAGSERCFIRSTATRGHLGGLTSAADQMLSLMDAAGFDLVLVETVGTGQSEVAVVALADLTLVVFPPGLGDELQAIKAGILELADLLVVTKSDTAEAQLACQALQTVAPLWRNAPPILAVSALSGEGIAALADAIMAGRNISPLPARRSDHGRPEHSQSLTRVFESLRSKLDAYLPLAATVRLSAQLLVPHSSSSGAVLEVVCSAKLGADTFQLGAVAGALAILAAEDGLKCKMQDCDLSGGSFRLLLERNS